MGSRPGCCSAGFPSARPVLVPRPVGPSKRPAVLPGPPPVRQARIVAPTVWVTDRDDDLRPTSDHQAPASPPACAAATSTSRTGCSPTLPTRSAACSGRCPRCRQSSECRTLHQRGCRPECARIRPDLGWAPYESPSPWYRNGASRECWPDWALVWLWMGTLLVSATAPWSPRRTNLSAPPAAADDG